MGIAETEDVGKIPTTLQTIEEFEACERKYGRDENYEFVRGRSIPSSGTKQDEISIASFLLRRSVKTAAFQRGDELLSKTEICVDGKGGLIGLVHYAEEEKDSGLHHPR